METSSGKSIISLFTFMIGSFVNRIRSLVPFSVDWKMHSNNGEVIPPTLIVDLFLGDQSRLACCRAYRRIHKKTY